MLPLLTTVEQSRPPIPFTMDENIRSGVVEADRPVEYLGGIEPTKLEGMPTLTPKPTQTPIGDALRESYPLRPQETSSNEDGREESV
jgi:hypothetical protein